MTVDGIPWRFETVESLSPYIVFIQLIGISVASQDILAKKRFYSRGL